MSENTTGPQPTNSQPTGPQYSPQGANPPQPSPLYPQQGPAYQPQGSYPPQDQPYPPQGPQYPPQGPAYPQGASYPPQGPAYPPQGGYPYQDRPWNTLCIVGFVLAFLIPPIGLILSIIALVQINRSGEKSKGLSIAGIIVSGLGTLFTILFIAALSWIFSSLSFNDDQVCMNDTCTDYSDIQQPDTDSFAGVHHRDMMRMLGDTQD